MMKEIIKQLEALLEEETPEKVRAAQKLAERIAELERQFAQQFPGSLNSTSKSGKSKVDPNSMKEGQAKEKPQSQGEGGTSQEKMENKAGSGGEEKKPEEQKDEEKSEGSEGQKTEEEKDGSGEMTDEERREALAEQAEQLAETGATLQDVLKAIMQSTDPADQDAIRKVEAILKEADFEKAIASMQQAADQIRSGELDDARLGGLDVADRMEIMSQRLDAAYQLIVAPRAEELRKLEEALAIMRERLESLETESQVIAWHREARQLLERIEELGVDTEVRDQLLEMMKQVGIGDSDITDWAVVSGRYVPPEQYGAALVKLQEDIQRRLQTLLLGDIETGSDEATPTKYKELVERYYEVLSRETTARNDKS